MNITTGETPQLPPARWPWQRSLQVRLALAYGILFLAALIALTIWIGQIVYSTQLNAAEHDLQVTAFLAGNALEDPLSGYESEFQRYQDRESEHEDDGRSQDDENGKEEPGNTAAQAVGLANAQIIALPRLQQMAAAYATDTGTRVTILDPNGNPLADSLLSEAEVGFQGDQPEVMAALAGVEQHEVRTDPATGKQMLYAAAPIQQNDKVLGIAQVGKSLDAVLEPTRQLLFSLVAAVLLALAATSALAVWIGRRLVKPIRELEEAALAVAQGDLSRSVPVATADEVGALANAFNHMVDHLRAMIAQQRVFVANASHELRTPLTNIKLRTEVLRTLGGEDTALATKYIAEIDTGADRLTRLANDLLDLARLDGDAWALSPAEKIDISPVLLDAANMMRMRAEGAGLKLTVDVPPRLPLICVHSEQIESAVLNLLDNAIKYTPGGGSVRLAAVAQSNLVEISVSDSGPGIPPADLPNIFDRFYRVDKSRSRQRSAKPGVGSGAGLGLSIVKTLIEQNDGAITVESAPGKGTVFVLSFPLLA
ncbi:MAG: HAMP domain-containing protein [Anaerolineales bacterium]|nr:HAMP domain-containing protein [Anaerolineales bacterium]